MDMYYFNRNEDKHGNHEVHKDTCNYMPDVINREFIGYEINCKEAIKRAKSQHPLKSFDGCYYCSKECHNG